MTRDGLKKTLDVLSEWKCPEGIYYVLGYAPFSSPGNPDFEGGKCVISFGLSPHFGDTGQTWDVEIGQVPTLETLAKIEAALIGKLILLPMLEAQRVGTDAPEPAPLGPDETYSWNEAIETGKTLMDDTGVNG